MTEPKNNKEEEIKNESPSINTNIESEGANSQKQCKSCIEKIHISATVCKHCGQRQSWWGRHFSDITVTGSIVMIIIAAVQLIGAIKKNIDASKALETANTAVKKADDTIAELRELAKPLAEFTFSAVARTGLRITKLPRRDQYRLVKELESELHEIGITEEEIEACKKDWHRLNLEDLSWPIVKPIKALFLEKEKQQHNILKKFGSPILAGDPNYKAATEYLWYISHEEKKFEDFYNDRNFETFYSDMIHFMKTTDVFTEKDKDVFFHENEDELQDLDYYTKHKKFRRLEHWLDAKE